MADVKWIKITTDIFDDEKILLIESLPDAYAIITVWFKLLCLAGKMNNSGVFIMNNRVAYTDKMLATIFRMKETTVQLALQTFEQFGMIEVIDGVITIPNWNKHQSLDAYEKKKERDRLYQSERRANQRAMIAESSDSKTTQSSDVAVSDKEEEKDKEKDIDIRGNTAVTPPAAPRVDYISIQNLYNSICKSLPKCTSLSESRKKAIKARLASGYTEKDFETLFSKAEASAFLKGKNKRDWKANFDWLIKDANMAKVLDGNYDETGKAVSIADQRDAEILRLFMEGT
jgi:predicted phage replisome organizer